MGEASGGNDFLRETRMTKELVDALDALTGDLTLALALRQRPNETKNHEIGTYLLWSGLPGF